MPNRFHPGQRWISESEPELGLGEVRSVTPRTVTMVFGASEATREYRIEGAPLRRVAFRAGDAIQGADGAALAVRAVVEREGLLHYDCGERQLCETELSDALGFSGPRERFFAGRFDPPQVFDLRLEALAHPHRSRRSEVRGFLGGRIDLLPHQLGIAAEVAGRLLPRVLLADEVGLGKTIEAGLVLHRLLLTGRAGRVLVLVPESLVHQWFLELLRRFNLWFHIFDEARCRALEEADPGANPFLDDQLVLCHLGLFTGHPQRLQQALEAGWDLLVVDEAHHLGWSPEAASPEYEAVERLGRQVPGLLLLTATPEQLGMASHFARLRLLDPDRFFDLDEFIRESEGYREIARLAEGLREARALSAREQEALARTLGETPEALREKLGIGDEGIRKAWIEALLDQHGTGRVMFRNTRATVAGFPRRVAHLPPLELRDPERLGALCREWAADVEVQLPAAADEGGGVEPRAPGSANGRTGACRVRECPNGTFPLPAAGPGPDFSEDPRIPWLADLLHGLGREKVLLICRTRRKAEAIEAALKRHLRVKMAVFHEGLSLVQRDRGAAWFADANGARLLICSEIGSEGRNFQFAHHLVLFDLPLDPALLEQRLGRLDRIGQASEIQVHVPFVPGSPQEVLARWYQEGLDAFRENLPGGRELRERFEPRIRELASMDRGRREAFREGVASLVEATGEARREVAARLEQGRDRLLEWNSFRPEAAGRLIREIRRQDESRALDDFLLAVLEHFLVEVEEVAPRTYQLGSAGVLADAFPGLGSEGLTVTCDRARALAREDLQFLTWDHPLVTGALDLLLGSEPGNSSFARWPDAQASGFYLEAVFMLECVAPPHFHLDRFLPPTPLRILVDHRGRDAGEAYPPKALARLLKGGAGGSLMARPEIREELLPRLLRGAEELARLRAEKAIAGARRDMSARLEGETARLRDLQKVNRSVRDEEIALMVRQQGELDRHIREARLRLDALRLIHRGPFRG